jgi:salicylate hydroxylase
MAKARRIAIVGAGLGGLAAAITLRQQGFEVQVYEQADELAEFGAGINISPNSVKFFNAVGLADKLHAISSEPAGLTWRDWGSEEIHNCLPFGDFEKRYGAKYYVVHRSDLHRMLSEAVPQADIHLGKRCTQVETRNGSVGLSFNDGSSAEADVAVGCDGIRSAVRACLFGGEGPHYAGTMCWRALAPADALPKDYHDRHVNQWSGDGGFVISYYVRQGKFINFVCVRQQPGWTEQSWSVPSTVDEMLASFPHVGAKLRSMMAAVTSCSKWGQFTGEHAPQWTKGLVTLLGDSAHAMLATFGQGANMAFEDAYVLARWLRASDDDPDAALARYEAVRKPRATRVQQLSRTEVLFKKQHSHWDRLRREVAFLTRHGSTTGGVYRWIFGYDPVAQWRGS